MSTPPSLTDILNNILSAVSNIIGAIATAIAENATTIGTIVVIGALIAAVVAFGSRAFRPLIGWLRGLF
jgi:pantothenate kinase